MKKLNIFYALLLLSILTSCKKERPVKVDPPGPVIAAVSDSISYTVDGKIYTSNTKPYNHLITGNQQVGQKVVMDNNGTDYKIVGNPDSVLYYRENDIASTDAYVYLSAIKKYKKQDINKAFLYYPEFEDMLKLYTVGTHPYAEDFGRENSHDGIAIGMTIDHKSYFSYSTHDLHYVSKLKAGFQKGSTFEVISFTKATSGGYNLEARFTVVVAEDFTEDQKKVENGYLRLHLDTDPSLYPLF
ncbi:hypothetical protein SAMN05216464_12124 [Mucilaginibacter pineti]|uniref:Uncharacterized protein n=1 Tax=Mucilaginibacter pineti TaxID=1391627 RepID=A0A1G7MDS6_9SPHI|nr:hypothetical protein [Mucilaginibacter pineti]SDF59269.1 hypothetical protein SAMN05216464_12124 [Mucilaginibacter pineti]